jgi:ribonucleotide monophosphatase NagD (HAD superfamily)
VASIAIDLDGTIHDPFNRKPGYKMGQPIPGAVEAVKYLKEQGHHIIIFPTWADNMQRRKAIVDWLSYFKVPFDDVTSVKPEADFYIDNNAIRFESWAQTLDFINRKS